MVRKFVILYGKYATALHLPIVEQKRNKIPTVVKKDKQKSPAFDDTSMILSSPTIKSFSTFRTMWADYQKLKWQKINYFHICFSNYSKNLVVSEIFIVIPTIKCFLKHFELCGPITQINATRFLNKNNQTYFIADIKF